MASCRIHPELESRDRLNRWLGMPLFIGIGLLVLLSFFRELAGENGSWRLLLLHGPIALLFFWAGFYCRQSRWRHQRMTRVLEKIPGIPVKALVRKLRTGALSIRMRPLENEGPEWEMLFAPPAWDSSGMEGTVLKAHFDPEPNGIIVLETPNGILWPLEGSRYRKIPSSVTVS